QSIAGGKTMVMNRAAALLLRQSVARTEFVSHDWWAYLMVTGAGGTVHYSPTPHVRYRQHGGNLVGENSSWLSRLQRVVALFRGRFRRWDDINAAGLHACADLLTEEARATLLQFDRMRGPNPVRRLRALRQAGAYRQTTA